MRSGLPFVRQILFDHGPPTSGVAWVLVDGSGTSIASGTLTVPSGAASIDLVVSGTNNTLSGGDLFAYRDLSWSYSIAGSVVIAGTDRYRIEAFIPYGVSEQGVRAKLGVDEHELPNEVIDLTRAYADFRATVGSDALSAASAEAQLAITDALEAAAALVVLPSLMLRLAAKESSGTNQHQRFAADWEELRAWLEELVALGIETVAPEVAAGLVSAGSIFVLSSFNDPITGGA